MSKYNFFIKNFNNINKSINSLLEKNLNKLNFINLRNLIRNNKLILIFVAFVVLFISYLLLPTFYNQSNIAAKLENDLREKFKLELKISRDLKYNFFPRPHFTSDKSVILNNNHEISEIKKINIYFSLENLFSLKKIEVKKIIIEDANFNLNNKNYEFFIKLLDNNLLDKSIEIKNSKIFFRNEEKDVLFINKILNLSYYYDSKELKNVAIAKNEIFNIPYSIKLFFNKKDSIYTKINLDFIKLQIEDKFNFGKKIKKGKSDLVINKVKSKINYKINKSLFEFNYYDKLENSKFNYNGKFNFNPFYSSITGTTKELNILHFLDSNSIIAQLLKTEIFNNKNIDFKLNINADKFFNTSEFSNIYLNSKIQDGLIDLDNTKFEWKEKAEFKLSDSLVFVKDGQLFMDGRILINIKDYKKIYKFLLTPKNYRKQINKIDLRFSYNLDQNIIYLTDVVIDNQYNQGLINKIGNIDIKDSNLQNRIYLKNLLNEAIKNYVG